MAHEEKTTHRSHSEPISSKFRFCSWETWSFFTEDLSKQISIVLELEVKIRVSFGRNSKKQWLDVKLAMKPIMSSRVGICRTVDPMTDVATEGRLSIVPCQKGQT